MENTITDGRQELANEENSEQSPEEPQAGTATQEQAEAGSSTTGQSDETPMFEERGNAATNRWLERLPSGNNPVLLRRLLPIEDAPTPKQNDEKDQAW